MDQENLVWPETLFRLARDQSLQDAHSCAVVEISQLHALHSLQWCAIETRGAAVAIGLACRSRWYRCHRDRCHQ